MNVVEILRKYGLTKYEAEVYCALVKLGTAKVQDIAKITSVPRSQIYPTIKKLVNGGMCTENKGKVSMYSAVAPIIAFHDILENGKEAIQELNKIYSKNKQVKTTPPFEFIQVLKGKQIREMLNKIVNKAKKEILVSFKFPAQKTNKELDSSTRLEIVALKKGIKVRCLYDEECLTQDWILPYLQELLELGEDGRVVKHLPINMLIADGEIAAFSLYNQDKNDITVFLINHPGLISVMIDGFEYRWAEGVDIHQILKNKKYKKNIYYKNLSVACGSGSIDPL